MVCPFCSLLCDDLSVKTDAETVTLLKNRCPNAIKGFDDLAHTSDGPWLNGQAVRLRDAVAAATDTLRASKSPFIGGLGTDLDALRRLYKLAGTQGAAIDHMHSEQALANIAVMQTVGWYTTTLSEMRNRADIVVIVAADCKNKYARFLEKMLEPAAALAPKTRKDRRIVFLGPRKHAPTSKKLPIEIIPCEPSEIATLLSVLRGEILGKRFDRPTPQSAKLSALAASLRGAAYANIVWSTSALEADQARLCIETISKLISDLNKTNRAAGLSLGGDEGGMSAQQVSSWLSGYPIRVSYANGIPSYDPQAHRLQTLIDNGEIDHVIWVDAFGRSRLPNIPADIPLTFIGHPNIAKQQKSGVSIPVGLPGIHHAAKLTRTDAVLTVPLDRIYRGKLPSVSDVVDSLAAAL